MFPLVELLSADVAAQKSAAVLINPIGKVLTGHADTGPFPALKLLLVDEAPFLHAPQSDSSNVLLDCFRAFVRVERPGWWLAETQ